MRLHKTTLEGVNTDPPASVSLSSRKCFESSLLSLQWNISYTNMDYFVHFLPLNCRIFAYDFKEKLYTMKRTITTCLLLSGACLLSAQKISSVYKPAKSEMYRKGWIDFNKNGVKDVYEDPNATLDARIEDLLSQMTLDEKTCQMVTLYGYKRVLKDDLPTSEWKQMLWKDGILSLIHI